MIPLPGFVYFDPKFVFNDGAIGPKLFIVLIDSPINPDYVLVARATTTPKCEPTYGCHDKSKWEKVFYVPADGSTFPDNTWVTFNYLKEYRSAVLERWARKGDLTIAQTKHMLICASQSYTLENVFRDAFAEYAARLEG